MKYEVEQKYRVQDFSVVEKALHTLGGELKPAIEQEDCYFRHPSRDFAATDEAFRLRRVGQQNFVTYKGPKISTTTKTRQEIELPLLEGTEYSDSFLQLLEKLGFEQVARVRKSRRACALEWRDSSVEVVLDEVDEVGQFVELELIAEEADLQTAQTQIQELAAALKLEQVERRSYLEQLLANQ